MNPMKIDNFFSKLSHPDLGLLIIRLVFGLYIAASGIILLQGGTDKYHWLGQQLGIFGITFAPTFWGFLAAFIEAVGGLMMLFGFLFRPVQLLLFFVMIVATAYHFNAGDDLMGATAIPALLAAVFLGLLFLGAGKYSVSK